MNLAVPPNGGTISTMNGSGIGQGEAEAVDISSDVIIHEIVDSNQIAPKPVVSVLMVTYNHEQYIAEAIEGVLQQETDFPFELIIGEDCSTDSTREIVRRYQKESPGVIRIIASERNTGLRENGRRVRDAARGKYVAYCDGDDLWHDPKKLQKQVQFLEENPDYVLVHTNYNAFYVERNRRISNCIGNVSLNDGNAYFEILANRRMVLTVTVCLRGDLLKKIADEHREITDPSWPLGDSQTWLEMARLGKVKYLPESLATYRYLPESASQSRNPQRVYRFHLKVRDLMLHYINKYECPLEVAREAKAFNAVCLMRQAYFANEGALMEVLLKDAKRHYVRIPLENWLYYYGTKYRVARFLVAPGLLALRVINRARRHLGRPSDLRRRQVRAATPSFSTA